MRSARRWSGAAIFAAAAAIAATPASVASAQPGGTLEGWPCKGCLTRAGAGRDAGAPGDAGSRPLLVVLHGDGGEVGKLFRAWRQACDDAGVILFAPRCPADEGCAAASWWKWYADRTAHDPAWLGAQIDAVAERFAVDRARVYAAGYSGGATYLGYYGPTNPTRFAAIAHVAGGNPWGVPCPACKYPVLFVIGSTDPMIAPYTRPLRQFYDACGEHEVVWEQLPGVTHEGIVDVLQAGRAKSTLAWLLARPAKCAAGANDAADARVIAAASDAGEIGADAGEGGPGAASPPRVDQLPQALPPRAPGCACEVGAGGAHPRQGVAVQIALAVAIAAGLAARRSNARGARRDRLV